MAHFAKLDDNNKVLEVHVVSNAALDPDNEEASGIEFLTNWSGGYTNWKQTSYNSTFRKNYAAPGYTYDESLDGFISPKPYPSWLLNSTTCRWEAPLPKPEGIGFFWDEEAGNWING